jgi:acetylornithine deacetylase/succinyl-diaminopimelate desuccinylase-like protein
MRTDTQDFELALKNIFSHIEGEKEKYVEELCTLLRQPSISATGEGMKDCAALLGRMMEDVGMSTRLCPTEGYPVVFGDTPSQDASLTLLIYGHYDVQPPEPLEKWHSNPFETGMENRMRSWRPETA